MTRQAPRGTPTPHKYHARRTAYRGAWYDSAGEAEYARRLDLLKAAGVIHDWRRGREWVLLDAPRRRDRITMLPDFEIWDAPDQRGFRVVDFKGVLTAVFRLKLKLWKAVYSDVPFFVAKADGTEVCM